MRKIVLLAAVAALSACNQNKSEPAPAASEAAATPAAVATAAAATSMAGTYDYTYKDKATTTVMKDDGTYEDSQDGKVIEKGKWTQADGKTCFADDKGNPPQCWTTTEPDSTGMFTATSVDGKTVLHITKKKA
jgi:hypothetical protein